MRGLFHLWLWLLQRIYGKLCVPTTAFDFAYIKTSAKRVMKCSLQLLKELYSLLIMALLLLHYYVLLYLL